MAMRQAQFPHNGMNSPFEFSIFNFASLLHFAHFTIIHPFVFVRAKQKRLQWLL